MVKIKGRVFKVGRGYAMTVPKAIVEGEILNRGSKYEFELLGVIEENNTPLTRFNPELLHLNENLAEIST